MKINKILKSWGVAFLALIILSTTACSKSFEPDIVIDLDYLDYNNPELISKIEELLNSRYNQTKEEYISEYLSENPPNETTEIYQVMKYYSSNEEDIRKLTNGLYAESRSEYIEGTKADIPEEIHSLSNREFSDVKHNISSNTYYTYYMMMNPDKTPKEEMTQFLLNRNYDYYSKQALKSLLKEVSIFYEE